MTKNALVESVKATDVLWAEVKRDWRTLGFPGFPTSPVELLIRLLLHKLGVETAEQLKQLLDSVPADEVRAFKQLKVIPAYWAASDPNTVFLLKLIFGQEENAADARELVNQVPEVFERPEYPVPSYPDPDVKHEVPEAATEVESEQNIIEESASDDETTSEEGSEGTVCRHVSLSGDCVHCTDEEVFECDECKDEVPKSRMVMCKNVDECQMGFCTKCAETEINEHGYCSDCAEPECDLCQNTYINGAQKQCSSDNPKCDYVNLCDPCAGRFLNESGECPTCSGEETSYCSDCPEDDEFTASKIVDCVNAGDCQHGYCPEHLPGKLNDEGKCDDCASAEEEEEQS